MVVPAQTQVKGFPAFLNFQATLELQLGCKIKALHSDWGLEYRAFIDHLSHSGIIHRNSCLYNAHGQNGLAEVKHRHIVECGLTLFA